MVVVVLGQQLATHLWTELAFATYLVGLRWSSSSRQTVGVERCAWQRAARVSSCEWLPATMLMRHLAVSLWLSVHLP